MTARQILANNLGCEEQAVADALFPISKGFTEKERIDNLSAIYAAMSDIKYIGKTRFPETEAEVEYYDKTGELPVITQEWIRSHDNSVVTPPCELNPDSPCDDEHHCNTVCWQRSGNKDILSKSHAVAARSGVISMLTEMIPEQIRNEILEPVHPGLGNRIWASEIYDTFMIFRRTVPVSYDWNKEEGRSTL